MVLLKQTPILVYMVYIRVHGAFKADTYTGVHGAFKADTYTGVHGAFKADTYTGVNGVHTCTWCF